MRILIFFLFLCTKFVHAQEKWTLSETNDAFTFLNHDIDFTQGVQLQRETEDNRIKIGQNIYTPIDKNTATPMPGERPYAGYIYFEFEQKEAEGFYYGASLGLIGENAGGKQAQCEVHKLINISCPNGWKSQLKNEITGELILGTEQVYSVSENLELQTYIEGRAGSPLLGVIASGIFYYSPLSFIYFLAGAESRYIFHDTLIDGNIFRDFNSQAESRSKIGALVSGIGIIYESWEIECRLTISSPTYKEQPHSYNYGSINISKTW